jgi:hypothetical protein
MWKGMWKNNWKCSWKCAGKPLVSRQETAFAGGWL